MLRSLLVPLLISVVVVRARSAEPAPGAYRKVSPSDAWVVAAARFAVEEQASKGDGTAGPGAPGLRLEKIVSAEEQIVAGANYRLQLRLHDGAPAKMAEAVVWSQPWNRPAPLTLTSWTWKTGRE